MIRFGILSTAKIAREHVIPAIGRAGNAQLMAIASREEKKARKCAQQCGAEFAFGSYEAMLASDAIDAVYIPLPTSHHIEWTLKAIKAGKHVLCEKPIALKAADISRLMKAGDKAGLVVSEAFMVTYHPQWHKVRELLARGAIGKLRMIDASFTYFNRDKISNSMTSICACTSRLKWQPARQWYFTATKALSNSPHRSTRTSTRAMKCICIIADTMKQEHTDIPDLINTNCR